MPKESISIKIDLKEGQKITYMPLSNEVKEYLDKLFEKNHEYYLGTGNTF